MNLGAVAAALDLPWAIEASAHTIIRAIAERDDLPAELAKLTLAGPQAVASRIGRPIDGANRATLRDGVATIPVRGPIVRHSGLISEICGSSTIEQISRDLSAAMSCPTCHGVILEIDSPGGQVTGVGELASMIHEAAETKPVIAYVDGSACSAAYFLAAACSEIVTAPMGRLGSIGVIQSIPKKDRRPGADAEYVSSQSPLKAVDPESETGAQAYQQSVDDLAAIFIADVAKFRGVSEETVKRDFGRGGSQNGNAAVKSGLADRTGSYESLHRELSGIHSPPRPAPQPITTSTAFEDTAMWKKGYAWFGAKGKPEAFAENDPVTDPNANVLPADYGDRISATLRTSPIVDPRIAEMEAEITRLKAAVPSAESLVKEAAVAWADNLAISEKIVPAERADVIEMFEQAALDDLANPIAGKPSARRDQFKKLYENRPRHGLTSESVGVDELPSDARVLPAHRGSERAGKANEPTAENAKISDARRDHLLALTQHGQKILAARQK